MLQRTEDPARGSVLIVNPGGDVYGSDLQMLESVTAFVQAGRPVVVVMPERGRLWELVLARGATPRLLDFPVVRRSYLSLAGVGQLVSALIRAAPRMLGILAEVRPDLVYVNTTTLPWWIAVSRFRGYPVVCHVHEAEAADNAWVLRALNAPLLLADRLIVISETSAQATWAAIPQLRGRSRIVFNGVPDRDTPPVPRPGESAATERVRLVVVGRLSPRKGTDVAVRALAELVRGGQDAVLEVAGSAFPGYEWFTDQLHQTAAEEGVEDRVTFTGYVSPSFIAFDRADIVLAPSLREPFGNAVVEAQLSRRPVVAAAAGGHTESIVDGQSGVLVPPADPVAMARAVASLWHSPELMGQIGRMAREHAVQRFGLERYRREIVAVAEETTCDRR